MVEIDMDMPERCDDCRFKDDNYSWCWADELGRCAPKGDVKADWCPLKEQDKQKVLQHLADVQLANAPNEYHNETQRIYEKGVYDGIQMAFEIIAEHS